MRTCDRAATAGRKGAKGTSNEVGEGWTNVHIDRIDFTDVTRCARCHRPLTIGVAHIGIHCRLCLVVSAMATDRWDARGMRCLRAFMQFGFVPRDGLRAWARYVPALCFNKTTDLRCANLRVALHRQERFLGIIMKMST